MTQSRTILPSFKALLGRIDAIIHASKKEPINV